MALTRDKYRDRARTMKLVAKGEGAIMGELRMWGEKYKVRWVSPSVSKEPHSTIDECSGNNQ